MALNRLVLRIDPNAGIDSIATCFLINRTVRKRTTITTTQQCARNKILLPFKKKKKRKKKKHDHFSRQLFPFSLIHSKLLTRNNVGQFSSFPLPSNFFLSVQTVKFTNVLEYTFTTTRIPISEYYYRIRPRATILLARRSFMTPRLNLAMRPMNLSLFPFT